MNDFKKGLLVGIVIMSSIFLLIASTTPEMGRNDRREIVKYKFMNSSPTFMVRDINLSIKKGWQPFGSPFMDNNGKKKSQAMVKYKED